MPQLEAGRRCRWKVRVDHAGMGRGTRARPTDRGRGLVRQPGRPGDVLDGNRNALRAYHEGDRVSEAFWPIIAARWLLAADLKRAERRTLGTTAPRFVCQPPGPSFMM